MMKDYYRILGLTRDADQTQIKKAYREKMKMYHPDAGGGKEDQDKLIEIQEAYEVLSDKERKREYDENLKRLKQKINNFSEIRLRILLSPMEAKYGTRFHAKIPLEELCPNCGLKPDPFCTLCRGYGSIVKYYYVSIPIPSGVRNGSVIRSSLKIDENKYIRIIIKILISPFSSFF